MASKKLEDKYVVVKSDNKAQTVSARVPYSVYSDFKKAEQIASENGMELTLSNVVQIAMQDAIKEVRAKVGEEKLQGDLLK